MKFSESRNAKRMYQLIKYINQAMPSQYSASCLNQPFVEKRAQKLAISESVSRV